LFRYCQSVIDLDAEISDRAFDLGVPEQELDSPKIARPSIDQGSIARQKNFTFATRLALACYAMLGRKADAHLPFVVNPECRLLARNGRSGSVC
jgi:hypothetical protein